MTAVLDASPDAMPTGILPEMPFGSTGDAKKLRIVVIAPLRYPIAEPHPGGLESSIWHHVSALRARGHQVIMCAVEGSDFLEGGPDEFRMPAVVWGADETASDVDYPAGYLEHALPTLDRALLWMAENAGSIDLIDNHCLHGAPLAWAGRLGIPMVTTLHTPALDDLVAAHRSTEGTGSSFIAVSEHTAAEWARVGVDSVVMPNAIDTALWPLGAGGEDLVWSGRLVPEKGPHLAIDAARMLGRRIVLAGRIGDLDYAEREIWPRLGPDVIHVGALRQPELARLVGASSCALVTPVWEEPFGLVIAEALAVGTPVATFGTGGVPEVVGASPGAILVDTGDVAALSDAVDRLIARSATTPLLREQIRADAVARFSFDNRVVEVERLYRGLVEAHQRVGELGSVLV